MKIIEYALQLEADGKAYYERLAAEAVSAELKTLFTLLAEAEQAHYDALKARRAEPFLVGAESPIVEQAKNIFQSLLERREQDAPVVKTASDNYQLAIKAEEQSIAYYREAAEQETSAEVRSLLLYLAAEEKLHLNIIENIYEFVQSPKYFLEWQEFSNRKEL